MAGFDNGWQPNQQDMSNQGGGILGGAQQPSWANTLGILSSAVKDFANNYNGRGETDNLANWQQRGRQQQIQAALAQGFNSDDPAIRKLAAMTALASGIDPTPWLNLTRAKVEHVGDDLVSSDPFDPTNIKTVFKGGPPPPSGYDRKPDGSMSFIPGGPGDPVQAAALAGGRREPPPGYLPTLDGKGLRFIPGGPADPRTASMMSGARRAPPKAAAAGAINLPHPGSLY